ncbi:MAG: hypothetical protein IPL21_18055 [Saprospirales bacterium]|nr:hypothetical protein [Saprospirales bacterium]
MLGFIAGLITANASEWYIHKYWLHERGKIKVVNGAIIGTHITEKF